MKKTYVALSRRYPWSGSASYLPTRVAPLALAHKSYLPTPRVWVRGEARGQLHCARGMGARVSKEKKRRKEETRKREKQKAQHRAPPAWSPTAVLPRLEPASLFGWEAVNQADMAALKKTRNLKMSYTVVPSTITALYTWVGERPTYPLAPKRWPAVTYLPTSQAYQGSGLL